jgi:hypothetical protein
LFFNFIFVIIRLTNLDYLEIKLKEIKTVNQAVLLGNIDSVKSFLNNDIHKGHFRAAFYNSIKFHKNDSYELLFNFNLDREILDTYIAFPDILKAATISNNVFILNHLKLHTDFSKQLINCKNKKNYFFFLFNNICSSNNLEALQFFLDDNLSIIQHVFNHKDSMLAFKEHFNKLFIHSASSSKTSIVKYLYNFDFIKENNEIVTQATHAAINCHKLNTFKFLTRKIKLNNEDIFLFLESSLDKVFINFSKYLIKEFEIVIKENNFDMNYHVINSEKNVKAKLQATFFCSFLDYLLDLNFYIDLKTLSNNSENIIIKEESLKLLTKKNIVNF